MAATNVVGSASVEFNGSVNPNGSGTEVYFEYGRTTGYGSSTTQTNIGTAAGIYTIVISGSVLEAGQPYNYRVDAVNGAGTNYGSNVTFTAP